MPIPRHRVRSISWVTGDDHVSCDPRVASASGCLVLNEKVSRLTLDPAFRLDADAPSAAFPVYAGIRAMRSHHHVTERTLIIGAGPLSTQLATTLADHPEFGLQPIGFLDARRIASGASMAVMGDYASLERVVRQFEVRRIIIGFGRNLDLVQMVRNCQALRVRTHLIARGADLGIAPEPHHVDGVMC